MLAAISELLTTEQVADRLSVSVETVRRQVRSILTKLDSGRRDGAQHDPRLFGRPHPEA